MDTNVKKLMGAWDSTEHGAFENLWDRCFREQFNEKLKPSAKCYKKKIAITEYILNGTGKKSGKEIEFDGLTVLTSDHKPILSKNGAQIPVIINLEYTIQTSPSKVLDYWTLETKPSDGKLIKLMKFLDTNGNPPERKERLKRLHSKYPSFFPTEEEFDTAYLIGIDRFRDINLSNDVLQIQNNIDKSFAPGRAKVSVIPDSRAILVEMDGFKIIAGVLSLGQCADHMATVFSLSKILNQSNDMKQRFFERSLFELTQKAAGEDYALLSTAPLNRIPVTVLSNEKPDPTTNEYRADTTALLGKNVETFRLRICLRDLLRMCSVERTINEVGALQRLPEIKHMSMIAKEGIMKQKEFVNPLVISTTNHFIVKKDSKTNEDYIEPSSTKSHLSHYSWALIDGQHRVFSAYMVDLDIPKLSNTQFDVVIRYLDSAKIPAETRNDINADTFFDLNYRTLPPKADVALVRSTEISSWPNDWIPYQTRLMIYSSRVLAARFLLELNKHGVLKNRFGLGGSKFGKGQIGLSSATTYLGDTYNHFDLYFQYVKKGTPDHHKNSIGPLYASWNVKSSKGNLVFPDNKEWTSLWPKKTPTNPNGLSDNKKRGLTCKELEQREFWKTVANDFNQFLNEITKNLNTSLHKFTEGGKDYDWTDEMACLCVTKNSGAIPALFGAWFAYVKKHRPPSRSGAKHSKSKNFDPRIGKALAGFFEDKLYAKNPRIPNVSPSGGLFKNSDGKGCTHNYSSANGMKLFRTDLINVINHSMSWSGTSDEIEF